MKQSHLTVQVNECKMNATFSPFYEKRFLNLDFLMENYNKHFLKKFLLYR